MQKRRRDTSLLLFCNLPANGKPEESEGACQKQAPSAEILLVELRSFRQFNRQHIFACVARRVACIGADAGRITVPCGRANQFAGQMCIRDRNISATDAP